MPTPDRTSLAEIIMAGRSILEESGLARLTMQAVAARVGVRAPSLYKRVDGRDALIMLIGENVVQELGERLGAAGGATDAAAEISEIARAFREFAHANPVAYQLVFAPTVGLESQLLGDAASPLLHATARLAGDADALPAAHTLTAWAHGFISMELAGAFQLGGDVERAWEFGLSRLASSLSQQNAAD